MTAPKHRFIKNLENEDAISFANSWAQWYRKKSLAPMVSYLQKILDEYDDIEKRVLQLNNHIIKNMNRNAVSFQGR